MKAIIYAGIGLFSVVTVYGVADHYKAKKTGKLEHLYREDAPSKKAMERTIDLEDYSRGKIEGSLPPETIKIVSKETNKAVIASSKRKGARKARRTKNINMKMFSRGRLEEPVKRDHSE